MAASNAMIGWGSTITGMQSAEIKNMRGPTSQSDKIDVTHYASPDGYKEYILGLVDPGEFTCSCNYTASAYAALKNLQVNRTKTSFSVTFPDAGSVSFEGYVMGCSLSAPVAGVIDMEVTVLIAGAIS